MPKYIILKYIFFLRTKIMQENYEHLKINTHTWFSHKDGVDVVSSTALCSPSSAAELTLPLLRRPMLPILTTTCTLTTILYTLMTENILFVCYLEAILIELYCLLPLYPFIMTLSWSFLLWQPFGPFTMTLGPLCHYNHFPFYYDTWLVPFVMTGIWTFDMTLGPLGNHLDLLLWFSFLLTTICPFYYDTWSSLRW